MILILAILFTINVSGVMTLHGGINAGAQNSEFIVSIWYLQQHRCTGSILDKSHILTAGHCVKGLSPVTLSVSIGDSTLVIRDIELLPVINVHLHPGYQDLPCPPNANQCNLVNNIAIVELARELIWGPHLAAIQLFDREYTINPCIPCKFYGWNRDSIVNISLLRLRWTQALLTCKTRCVSVMELMRDENSLMSMFLSDEVDNEDYGSPIICNGAAVGILIDGGLQHIQPVILNIYPHLEFIARTIGIYEWNIPEQLPHYAAIFVNGVYWCGGSIVRNTYILTAGHCVENAAVGNLSIVVGRSEFYKERLTPSDLLAVDHIYMHPNYHHQNFGPGSDLFRNDIAILRLRAPLRLTNTISALGLSNVVPYGRQCRLYRWSRTTTRSGETLLKSMWSTVFIHSADTCRYYFNMLEPTAFCVWSMYSLPVAMPGDSGSPIVCNGFYAVGVLSSATQSTRLHFGPMQLMYYTSVYSSYQLIADTIVN